MLKVLPYNISNLIAAGEVVTRPASVIKELMENSIDAGADSVTVLVTDSGRTSMQVIDNGCGMSAEEAGLCFERHATSKIDTAEDLEKIATFGFRGEALASIAAVSEVTLKTRQRGAQTGTRTEIAASRLTAQEEIGTPEGSSFEIRNLFYNVPARRKFLKSDAAELRHIISEFTRVALTRPQVALRLVSNGKDIYNLKKVGNIKQRIHDLFGRGIISELVEIRTETSVVTVRGYIGSPEEARKTQGSQYLFVNGRYFRSPYFNKAVCKPYEKLIPEGYTPAYFIFLETPLDKVDVNIHPAKTEVKFEDESVVFDILMASVREALGKNSFTPSIDFDQQGAPDIPTIQSTRNYAASGYAVPPKIDYDPLFNPFDAPKADIPVVPAPSVDHTPGYGRLFEEESHAQESNLIQLQRRYIITPVKSGLMLIHIGRARERIFFERFLERIGEDVPLTQQTLFPQNILLSREDHLTLVGALPSLARMGFDIQDFGGTSVVVYGIPEGFPNDESQVPRIIDDIVAALKEDDVPEDYRSAMAARMARSAAYTGDRALSATEAQQLVDQLFACREPATSPDGHRCMTIITTEEIEKKL